VIQPVLLIFWLHLTGLEQIGHNLCFRVRG